MKKSSLITIFFLFVSACGGSDLSSLTIYGTTGDTTATSASTNVKTGLAKSASTLAGSPTSLKIEQHELWVSLNADCSSPVLVKDYGASPEIFEMAQGAVTMFTASPANGTYNCIIFKMGSVINFTPDSTAAAAFSSCTETEHSFDLFLEGQTFKDINGTDVAGQGTKLVPVDDAMYTFASTDTSAIPSTTAHPYQIIAMNAPLVVPGNSYMIMNFDNLIYEDTDTGTALCWVEAPTMGFSSTPSVDALRSWQGCITATETVTSDATSGGNICVFSLTEMRAQYYGGGDAHIVTGVMALGSDSTGWTEFSGAMTSRSVSSAMYLQKTDGTKFLAAAVTSPIPGIYLQSYNGSSWSDFSNQLTGLTAYNMQFRKDLTYFYISYAVPSANGPIRVFRLPQDGSSSDWEVIGLDIASTTSHAYVMRPEKDSSTPYSNDVYVTDTSSGLNVKKYTNSAGSWSALGASLTTSAIESHDMISLDVRPVDESKVIVAWTMPDSYQVTVAKYSDANGWQTIGDLSGVRASGVKISSPGSTIYLLYKDVNNGNALTIKTYTLGSSSAWSDLPSTITANGPTIYDFGAYGQTPYVLYSHTDSGRTPLLCKKFEVTR